MCVCSCVSECLSLCVCVCVCVCESVLVCVCVAGCVCVSVLVCGCVCVCVCVCNTLYIHFCLLLPGGAPSPVCPWRETLWQRHPLPPESHPGPRWETVTWPAPHWDLSHDYQINVSCLSRDCPAQQLNCTRVLQLVADSLEKLLASKEQCTLTSLLFFQHIVRRLCLSSLGFFIYIYFCVSINLFICIFVFVYCCHIISSSPFRPFQVLYLTGHTHSRIDALTRWHTLTYSRT